MRARSPVIETEGSELLRRLEEISEMSERIYALAARGDWPEMLTLSRRRHERITGLVGKGPVPPACAKRLAEIQERDGRVIEACLRRRDEVSREIHALDRSERAIECYGMGG